MPVKVFEFDEVYLLQSEPLLSGEDLLELYAYAQANLRPPHGDWRPRLVDLRQTQQLKLDYQKMARYTQRLITDLPPTGPKIAIVVRSLLLMGYARMFQLLVDTHAQVEIFEEINAACDWLEINDATRAAIKMEVGP